MSADGARIAPCPSVSARSFTAFPDVFEDSVAVAVSLCDAENDVQGRRGPPRRGDTCRTAKWVVLQSRLPTAAHRLDRCRTASRMDGSTCHREDCRLSLCGNARDAPLPLPRCGCSRCRPRIHRRGWRARPGIHRRHRGTQCIWPWPKIDPGATDVRAPDTRRHYRLIDAGLPCAYW